MKKFNMVLTNEGCYVDFARIETHMQEDLRDEYLRESDRVFVDEQEFYDAYADAHLEFCSEEFIVDWELTEMEKQSNYLMQELSFMTDRELLKLHNIFCWGWPRKINSPRKEMKSFKGLSRNSILNRTLNAILFYKFEEEFIIN